MQLSTNLVTIARVLRSGTPVSCEVASKRYVHVDPKGVGYVFRKGKFCPIVAVEGGERVTIETIVGALPETAQLKRAGNPQAAKQPVRGAAAQAPAKGSDEAKAKMAELRAKRAAKPAAEPKADAQRVTLDALAKGLASVAQTQAQFAERVEQRFVQQEAAFAAFVAQFAPRKRAAKA